jgi:hypothetical protein
MMGPGFIGGYGKNLREMYITVVDVNKMQVIFCFFPFIDAAVDDQTGEECCRRVVFDIEA